jgi:hypothetical protein
MKLFNMLESMFFITLGISCVLLLMLIYHFKQRVSKLEQSTETMFEILNNMVQELSSIKRGLVHPSIITEPTYPSFTDPQTSRINVSLSDDDESDSDDASLPDLIDCSVHAINNEDEDSYDDSDDDDSDDDDSDDDDSDDEKEGEVKVVSVDMDESLDNIDTAESVMSDMHDDVDENDNGAFEVNTVAIDEIHINKLDETNHLEENDNMSHASINTAEVYKKMNVPTLKSLVIEKGLSSDPSKLKKNDLIALLESNQ